MAINYRWIKGYNDTGLAADVPGAYTFLEWTTDKNYNGGETNQNIDNLAPKLYVTANHENERTDTEYVGRILTDRNSASTNQSPIYTQNIYQPWIFRHNRGVICAGIGYFNDSTVDVGNIVFEQDSGNVVIRKGASVLATFSDTGVALTKNTSVTGTLNVSEETILTKKLTVSSGGITVNSEGLSITGNSTFSDDVQAKTLHATDICEAAYFNARSDLRAKKDINEHDFSDAFINDILESICTYHFKKDASDDPIFIGLIAQRVISICTKHNVDPRIFVNHLEATGENGDYMSLNINNLMFLFALGLRHEKSKQLDLAARIEQLEEKING